VIPKNINNGASIFP